MVDVVGGGIADHEYGRELGIRRGLRGRQSSEYQNK
jgi:hypothetical protein